MRPKPKIDWKIADKLLESGCYGTEIAAYFGIHPETLYKRVEDEIGVGFTEYARQKRARGDSFLKAKQTEVALKGNVSMLIWLGKQRLGQKDSERASAEEIKTTFVEMKKAIEDGSLLEMIKQIEDANKPHE